MNTITRDELIQRLDSGERITLVEALPFRYYDSGHLPGASNLPIELIRTRAEHILPNRNATIVVYCSNAECQNSKTATGILASMGYNHVYEYVEGKQDWGTAGLPLEKSAA